MANYGKIARDAVRRRKELRKDLARAAKTVSACENELAILDQIIGALKGAESGAGRRGAKRGRRKGGTWRPGRPGRPPNWWLEKQKGKKAAGKGRSGRKRRGRRKGAAASKPMAATPTA